MTTPSEASSSFNEEETLYYYLSIMNLLQGIPIKELEMELKFQEKLENYPACSGILKAINEAEYRTYSELKLIAEDLDNDYNF